MSRHRNIRSMNYEDEYDGYDDVYGHSVEDDYCVSPGTAAQFMFNREGNHPLFSYAEPSIQEEEEEESEGEGAASSNKLTDSCDAHTLKQNLNAQQLAMLNSRLEEIRNIIGDSSTEAAMVDAVIVSDYDLEKALNILLNQDDVPKPQREPRRRPNRDTQADTSTTPSRPTVHTPSLTLTTPHDSTENSSNKPSDESRVSFSIGSDSLGGAPSLKSQAPLQTPSKSTKPRPQSGSSKTSQPSSASSTPSKKKSDASSSTKSQQKGQNGVGGAETRAGDWVNDFSDFGGGILEPPKTPDVSGLGITTSGSSAALHKSASKAKMDKLDVQKEYEKRQADGKQFLNLVVIGHVDAGKSTLMGHVLYRLGFVNQRTMHKYKQESQKLGKSSFAFAWVLDETEEERSRGVTMDIAQTRFETETKCITLLDAPGHKDFIPNMITGASQADVAMLVINATKGEFETGFETGGQTREHAMLVRSLGVSQVLIAVNKMDTVEWSQQRYDEVVNKLGQFLKQVGFRDSDVSYVPCSGLSGDNLTGPVTETRLTSWYNGPTLVEQIDQFKAPERQVLDKPLRLCVTDVFKTAGAGGFSLAGTVQCGNIQAGDRVLAAPAGEVGLVKGVSVDETAVTVGFAGDNVIVNITGIDVNNVSVGTMLCDPASPIEVTSRVRARVIIFNIALPITAGFSVVFHYQSLTEQAVIRKLVSQLHRSSGEVIKKKPRCLVKNTSAVVDVEVARPVCVELYKNNKDLGRFMLRSAGSTIAAGMIIERSFASNNQSLFGGLPIRIKNALKIREISKFTNKLIETILMKD